MARLWIGAASAFRHIHGDHSRHPDRRRSHETGGRQVAAALRSLSAPRSGKLSLSSMCREYFPLFYAVCVGSGFAIVGVVAGQMLLSTDGIGYLITYHRTSFDPA